MSCSGLRRFLWIPAFIWRSFCLIQQQGVGDTLLARPDWLLKRDTRLKLCSSCPGQSCGSSSEPVTCRHMESRADNSQEIRVPHLQPRYNGGAPVPYHSTSDLHCFNIEYDKPREMGRGSLYTVQFHWWAISLFKFSTHFWDDDHNCHCHYNEGVWVIMIPIQPCDSLFD